MNWAGALGFDEKQLQDLRYTAYCYAKQGIYDTAITFFQALLILNPQNAYDLQMLGALHLQVDQPLKALDFLDRSLKLDPTHLPSQLNRAKALLHLGYRQQSLTLASFLEKQPNLQISNQAKAFILANTPAQRKTL